VERMEQLWWWWRGRPCRQKWVLLEANVFRVELKHNSPLLLWEPASEPKIVVSPWAGGREVKRKWTIQNPGYSESSD
jgi:hypothetical protein